MLHIASLSLHYFEFWLHNINTPEGQQTVCTPSKKRGRIYPNLCLASKQSTTVHVCYCGQKC